MGKELKNLLSEVNRMNDLMMFTENRQIINESIASSLKSLRLLVKNSLNDIAKFGIKEVDNIVSSMVNSKSADEFFDLLDSIKLHDESAAKQLRRDIFDVLPQATQNRIIRIVNQIEGSIDSIPEDKMNDLLDDIIAEQFPNEPESVRLYMKDTLLDSSSTISNKAAGAKATKSIDDFIKKISNQGDSVEGEIDKIKGLTNPERAELKRSWRTLWLRKESFYDIVRRRAHYGGKESAQMQRATDAEIEKIMSVANDANKVVQDETAIAALNKALSSNIFTALPKWVKIVLISGLLSKGASFSLGMSLIDIAAWAVYKGGELLGYEGEKTKTIQSGGITKLNLNNKIKILEALSQINPSLFSSSGTLKSDLTIEYSGDEKSLTIMDNEGSIIGTYTIDQINEKLIK